MPASVASVRPMLEGRRALVVGDASLADALARAGAGVSIGDIGDGRAAARDLGGIDVLVYAAPPPDRRAPIVDVDAAAFDALWEQPMCSFISLLQAAYPHLRASGDGRVVVVVPNIAVTGAAGHAPAAASAEGLRALAKSAARQWGGEGITVNCVAIGSDAGPAGLSPAALGRPVEIGAIVTFLASAASRELTGATLTVDGGVVMSL